MEWLPDGYGISNLMISTPAPRAQKNVTIGRADFVLILRTGQMERCLKEGKWGGLCGRR